MSSLCLIALLLSGFAAAQFEDKVNIDQFTQDQGAFVCVTTTSTTGCQFTDSVSGPDSDILGGERDLIFSIEDVRDPNYVFSCAISGGELSLASANVNQAGSLGILGVQWDGSASIDLDPNGLNGLDLTANYADRFHMSGRADSYAIAELRIYSGDAKNYCYANFTVTYASSDTDIFLLYDDFTEVGTGCSFTNVGAIQLVLDVTTNVYANLDYVRTYGPIAATTPSVNVYEFYTQQGQPIGLGQSSYPISLDSNLSPNVTLSGLELETNASADISVYTYGNVFACQIANVDGTELELSVAYSDSYKFSTKGNVTEAGSLCWPADPDRDLVCLSYSL